VTPPADHASETSPDAVDEFDWIERCLKPLAAGAHEALGLSDDAAVIAPRPGQDLVISKDAMVEGVHFLPDDPLDQVARKLLRVNLSDLAAKGAAPYGYLLATAWPSRHGWVQRQAFAAGLAEDQRRYGIALFGGDTVATPGPFSLSLTILGWVPQGRMVRRSGAQLGDVVLVSGTIGDGVLGLAAAQGRLEGADAGDLVMLADRYRLPRPRVELAAALRETATAAADVSDGLIADAGHIAAASAVRMQLELTHMPLSPAARRWLERQPARDQALVWLASGGDDYEVLCAARPQAAAGLIAAAADLGVALTAVGRVVEGEGVETCVDGAVFKPARAGYRHR